MYLFGMIIEVVHRLEEQRMDNRDQCDKQYHWRKQCLSSPKLHQVWILMCRSQMALGSKLCVLSQLSIQNYGCGWNGEMALLSDTTKSPIAWCYAQDRSELQLHFYVTREIEDAVHLFFNCEYAQCVWRTMGLLYGHRLMRMGDYMEQIWDNSMKEMSYREGS